MKSKLLLFINILLISIGLTFTFSPQINSYIIEKRIITNVSNTEAIPPKILQENLKTDSEFDFDSISEISPSQTFFAIEEVDDDFLLGRLLIPSIDLNISVYNGVTNSILNVGVGTMRPNLQMGKGNFPIAGHYASNKKVLFGNLTSVDIDDSIYLTDNETVYEYRVYDTKVVDPTETEWIQDEVSNERGKPVVSLMNCYYIDGKRTDNRYFVLAELFDTYDLD